MVTPNGDKSVSLTSNIIPFKYDISNPFTSYSNNNFILRSNYIYYFFNLIFFNSYSRKIDHYYTSEYSNSFFSYDDQVRSKIFLELIASELTVAYATQGLIMSEPIKKTKSSRFRYPYFFPIHSFSSFDISQKSLLSAFICIFLLQIYSLGGRATAFFQSKR